MSSGAVEFVKNHPFLSGAVFAGLGILAAQGGIRDAKAYEEMLAGADVSGRVVSVSEGMGSKRGRYAVEYEWTDYRGTRHQGSTRARSGFLGSLKAGDRIVLGVDPVDPERAKPKEYMRERKPVRLGPLVGTDTLYVGAFMVVSGILVALFVRP